MNGLKKSKAFYVIVLLLSFLFLWKEIKNITIFVQIFQITVNTLLVPTIVSLFVYYLLRPLYLLLTKHLKNELFSLIFSLLTFLGVFFFLVREFIPLLLFQIDILMKNVPQMIQEIDEWIIASRLLSGQDLNETLLLINHSLEDFINLIFVGLRSGTNLLFGFVSSSFLVISIMPIMVIYLLKNTNKTKNFHQKLPVKYQTLAYDYFVDLEKTLSDYISGKALVCFYVFLGAWLTFSIAGLKGALLFAVVAGIMDIVPYFGPWIGAIPAVIAGLITSDVNALIIIVGIVIVQLGESYIVSPYVMSKELKMHPLFVIIVMLITGQAFGILGMIIVLPVVAALKVTLTYGLMFRQQKKVQPGGVIDEE
ncbi:MAG: AI-2E family transporter [Enterococcus lemanii]